jgi:hypothetical protein
MFWVDNCLVALLWGDGNETLQNVIKIKLVLYGNTRSHELNQNMENHLRKQCNHNPHASGLAN